MQDDESNEPREHTDEADEHGVLPQDAITDLAPEEADQNEVKAGSKGFYEWVHG